MSDLKYEIVYKRKKSFSISINNEGKVKVSVPLFYSEDDVKKILKEKETWIKSKLKEIDERKKVPDNMVMYKGEFYPVEVKVQPFLKRNFVSFFNKKFLVNVIKVEETKDSLEEWIKSRTLEIVEEKVNKYSSFFSLRPIEIKVKKLKSRWGSCSYDNRITINSRLSMVKEEVIEYVVVHEMCHMIHKNHSKEYWSEVERIMPNYEERHRWLKENGYLVDIKI